MTARPRTARALVRSAALALPACVLLAGCSHSVQGQATPEGAGSEPGGYARLLEECTVVPVETIAETAGVQALVSTFSGAVCRWRSIDESVDVQMNWFETGTLDRERDTARDLGYTVQNVRVSGSVAALLRAPDDPSSCGAVARAGQAGVVGWWVHGVAGDACAAAQKLVELSVDRTL